ncbi:hypothetical protein BDR07DRAFT_1496686 [Suillus spraguei]|nr:hypothetical protein BDR07DRAFT_1496686 [Suillus spraguei]
MDALLNLLINIAFDNVDKVLAPTFFSKKHALPDAELPKDFLLLPIPSHSRQSFNNCLDKHGSTGAVLSFTQHSQQLHYHSGYYHTGTLSTWRAARDWVEKRQESADDDGFIIVTEILTSLFANPNINGRLIDALIAPCSAQEIYNTMLRNVIEHILGVLKKRFRIILLPPEYNSEIQSRIPPALCLIHNIICIQDPDDLLDYHYVESDEWRPRYIGMLPDSPPTEAARTRAHDHRDQLAQAMWVDYLAERRRRGELMPPGVQDEL